MSKGLAELSSEVAAILERAGPSVVRVEGARGGSVSGIIFDSGLIVTAYHALDRDEQLTIGFDGGEVARAELVGGDVGTDIAVARLSTEGRRAPDWSDLSATRVGHFVLSGMRPGRTLRSTLGIVSALGESWRTPQGGSIDRYLQTDLEIAHGFSGSLLLDAQGRALGMNTRGLLRGAPLAVPHASIERVVRAVLAHGRVRRGYLGVGTYPVALPEALAETAKSGLMVVAVEPKSSAERAGFLLGDILVSLDGKSTSNLSDLLASLDEERIGSELQARVLRAGQWMDIPVAVGARP